MQRVRALRADDPQRRRKALRYFLEAALLTEFGPQLADDPEFGRMLDHVEGQLQSDARLGESAALVADILLRDAHI